MWPFTPAVLLGATLLVSTEEMAEGTFCFGHKKQKLNSNHFKRGREGIGSHT